jgi:hypothetical protein
MLSRSLCTGTTTDISGISASRNQDQKIHHEDTKATKKSREKPGRRSWTFDSALLLSFVIFVPSWCIFPLFG